MRAATWITGLVLAPYYDPRWSLQVFKAFSLHITHLTLSVQKPYTILAEFPKCPQLRHVELPSPVLRDVADIFPVLIQSPKLQHLSISHLKVDATGPRCVTRAQFPLTISPLHTLTLSYIRNAKSLCTLVSSIPTRALSILFESEDHASDLRNITGALFSESAMNRKQGHLKALHLQRSGRNVERSTIEERNIALEALREYCIRFNVEFKCFFYVSLPFNVLLRAWLIGIYQA